MSFKTWLPLGLLVVIAAPASSLAAQPTRSKPASRPTAGPPPPAADQLRMSTDPEAAGGGIEAVEDPGTVPGGKGGKDVAMRGTRRRPTRALVGVEVAGGVAIPLKKYLDFGSGSDTYYMENGVGAGIAVSLTLDNIELRWSYAALSAGRVRGRIPDDAIDGLRLVDQQMGGDGQIPQEIDIEAEQALKIHHVTLGYRLTFEPAKQLRLVVPIGVGVAVTQPPSFGLLSYSLYGFGGYLGFGGEWLIADLVAVGLDARMSLLVTEPDPNLSAAGYAATSNVFDAVVAWLPLLDIALHARIYY